MSDIDDKAMMEQFMANKPEGDQTLVDPKDKKEEPKEEPKVEGQGDQKPIEDKKEDVHTNTEEKPKEDTQEKPKEEPQKPNPEEDEVKFDLSTFNKAFGREFESEDQIKEILESASTLKAQLEEKEKLLEEGYNPMEYFANDKQFKLNQILKSNEDLNEAIVNRLVTSDLKEMSDEDVLLLNDLIETKGTYDEKIARLDIKDRYGLNENKEDLNDEELQAHQLKEYRLKKDADRARTSLQKMLDVELPDFKKPEDIAKERKEALDKAFNDSKESWQKFTDDYVKSLEKLTIPYKDDGNKDAAVEFSVDDKFKTMLKENLPQYAALMGKDLKKPNDVKAIHEQVQKDYFWMNRSNIVRSIIDDIEKIFRREQIPF